MSDNISIPETADYNSTRTTAAAFAIVATMVGTGGAFVSFPQSHGDDIVSRESFNHVNNLPSTIFYHVDDPSLKFRQRSKTVLNDFGFSVKQYADLMNVTRPVVYKWHDFSVSMDRIRSINLERLSIISDVLYLIKEDRRALLGSWLKNELDDVAVNFSHLIQEDSIDKFALEKNIQQVNAALRSLNISNNLDNLLGIS